jgi:hypothetical protein
MAQDTVSMQFDWPEGVAKHVVSEWSYEVLAPDGQRTGSSGVLREVWRMRRVDGGWALTTSDRVVARTGDKRDAVGMAIGRALDSAWSADFEGALALIDMPVPPPPAPEPTEGEAATADGEAAEATEAEATEAEPTEDAPADPEATDGSASDDPAIESTLLSDEDLVALVVGDRALAVEHLFNTFNLQTLPMSRDQRANVGMVEASTGEMVPAEVVRRVDGKRWCPGPGPGYECVEVKLTRAFNGADPFATLVEVGQRREVAAWVVEPSTLVPHHGALEVVEARQDAEGRRWTYRAQRTFRFLPAEAPVPPEEKQALTQ